MKSYLESVRDGEYPSGKARNKYLVECRVCAKRYWTCSWPKKKPRCQSCAGRQGYTPAKVPREDLRKRGDGYITQQGYHLIYDGGKYVPAHRLAFPDLEKDQVVHHIDGDKLNNKIENLIPLTKRAHREAHGALERISYKLIQSGLITYDRENNTYHMEGELKDFVDRSEVRNYPYDKWGRQESYPLSEDYMKEALTEQEK